MKTGFSNLRRIGCRTQFRKKYFKKLKKHFFSKLGSATLDWSVAEPNLEIIYFKKTDFFFFSNFKFKLYNTTPNWVRQPQNVLVTCGRFDGEARVSVGDGETRPGAAGEVQSHRTV